jgi:hypothetical protein
MTSSHFYVWSLYLQVPDLINGYGFWLYNLSAEFLWLTNWGAGVHLVMTFPRPLPAVQRRPALLYLPYLTTFFLHGLFLVIAWPQAANTLEWIGGWGQSEALVPVVVFLPVVWIIVYQYRSDQLVPSRKKIRLVVFSMLVGSSLTILFYLLPPLLGMPGLDANFIGVLLLLFPASLVTAILRYHLFDIDVLIHRTLVYSVLTAALALIYFSSVVLLQQMFRYFTGQTGRSQAAIVISTLAIATLFNPLRRRIQNEIDRRFYRQKYNTEKVLAAFSTILRDDVDLDRLTKSILKVVEETMQPAKVSLWLRDADLRSREQKLEENRTQQTR